MYNYVKAHAQSKTGDNIWDEVDIGDVPLNQVFQLYTKCFAVLTNKFLKEPVGFDVMSLKDGNLNSTITIRQFLVLNGTHRLQTININELLNHTYTCRYIDAFLSGYKVKSVSIDSSIDAQAPHGSKKDLLMTKQGVDYNLFYQRMLVNVNGYYHKIGVNSNGVFVQDGMVSKEVSGQNNLGVVDMGDLGNITYMDITPEMIFKLEEHQQLSKTCYIDLGIDLTGKTVGLVIGGYLHINDPLTFRHYNNTTIEIDFLNYPLIERYYESVRYLDLSKLGLNHVQWNPNLVAVNDFYSDKTIKNLLSLSQSFVIIIDTPTVKTKYIPLTKTPHLSDFVTPVKPIYPVRTGFGRQPPHWSVPEEGMWSVKVHQGQYDQFLIEQSVKRDMLSLFDTHLPERQFDAGAPAMVVYYKEM